MPQRGKEYQRLELLFEMLHKYLERPWSDIELGAELVTDRRNIWNMRTLMEENLSLPIEKHPTLDGKYYIHPDYELRHIRFTRTQMAALYMAGRRQQQQTRTSQRHVATMLEKVARALSKPLTESLVKAAHAIMSQEQDDLQEQIFATIVECWLEQVPVRITHRKLHGQAHTYLVEPYQIEPAVWGDGYYLIGKSDFHKGLATFKLSRIEKAVKSTGKFSVPASFNVHDLLKHAWGIWHADAEPTTVHLRFNHWATPRVKESLWHPQQTLLVKDDGSCELTIPVAEWKEMLPFIKGWGADCEVLAPAALRSLLQKEARRLAELYGVTQPEPPSASEPIAHTKNAVGERHNLVKHLQTVAALAAQFAAPFGADALAHHLGLWHDIGKFNPAFQQYLFDAELEPHRKQRGPDHKAAGARLAIELGLPFLTLLIQGHHGGLPSPTDFKQWYAEKQAGTDAAITTAQQLLPALAQRPSVTLPEHTLSPHAFEFFLRFLFSTLVDADFLDTEQHFNPERANARTSTMAIAELWQRFAENQQQLMVTAAATPVNHLRHQLYLACLQAATQPPGLFRLCIATGGGKTRDALAFALHHAQHHGLRRIIVAVPFLTITEQTANVYRAILEAPTDDAPIVLEHHSAALDPSANQREDTPNAIWQRLATENWDAPIIVTTTVQLFESLFANSTNRCRKLHRLAQSVIILDEAQALPAGLLDPILAALRELCTHYGSTVVLSTATQPAFEVLKPFQALPARDIIPNPAEHFSQLSRVTYEWRLTPKPTWPEIATWVSVEPQALVILNTKKDALALLDALADPTALHLSTLLCSAHRRAVVAEVKRRLAAGEPCRLISTQVVEAGVDLDFPLVLRAFGPLDSIIQAAGRANREGLLPTKGRVIIFDPADGGLPLGSYRLASATTRTLLSDGPPNMDDPASVARYFAHYYQLDTDHDKPGIQALRKSLEYSKVATKFHMIEDNTISVVVPYDPSALSYATLASQKSPPQDYLNQLERVSLLEKLRTSRIDRRDLLRQLQPCLVSLYTRQAQQLIEQGLISPVFTDEEGSLQLGEWQGHYDPVRGLVIQARNADQFVF